MINSNDTIVLDWDGTIFNGMTLIPGADALLSLLGSSPVNVIVVTNNSSRGAREYRTAMEDAQVWHANFQVVTSGLVTGHFLHDRKISSAFVLGTPSLVKELSEQGVASEDERPDSVVVGFDRTLTYEALRKAHAHIMSGLPYFATHDDPVCPIGAGSIPDCGSLIQLLKCSTGRSPMVIGKPNEPMVNYVQRTCHADAILTIGDRDRTDGTLARRLNSEFMSVARSEEGSGRSSTDARQMREVTEAVGVFLKRRFS